jgi:hypothetical protein
MTMLGKLKCHNVKKLNFKSTSHSCFCVFGVIPYLLLVDEFFFSLCVGVKS